MHDRTGGHRRLPVAARTLPGERLGLELPTLADAAGRTDETIRPPLRGEVAGARRPVRKPSIELRPRHRPIGFPSARHKNIMATFGWLSTDSSRPSYYHRGRRSQREEPCRECRRETKSKAKILFSFEIWDFRRGLS